MKIGYRSLDIRLCALVLFIWAMGEIPGTALAAMVADLAPSDNAASSLELAEKPNVSQFFSHTGSDYIAYLKNLTGYKWYQYATVAGATLALMPYDQAWVDKSHDYSVRKKFMTKTSGNYASLIKVNLAGSNFDISYPLDWNSAFWYTGDGMFSLEIMAGLAGYGYLANDYRSTGVSLQIFESLLFTASTVLPLKIMTGRQSPLKSTESGGKWQGYPGLNRYLKNQSQYYSFPSGHVATAVSTFTVLAENYTEHSWIAPAGGAVVGMLMVALMNVGSHWPSDYPMAVLIGYTAAHTVVVNHKTGAKAVNGHHSSPPIAERGVRWEGITPLCADFYCGLSTSWEF